MLGLVASFHEHLNPSCCLGSFFFTRDFFSPIHHKHSAPCLVASSTRASWTSLTTWQLDCSKRQQNGSCNGPQCHILSFSQCLWLPKSGPSQHGRKWYQGVTLRRQESLVPSCRLDMVTKDLEPVFLRARLKQLKKNYVCCFIEKLP